LSGPGGALASQVEEKSKGSEEGPASQAEEELKGQEAAAEGEKSAG
jgi:hypothetical protein